MHSLTQDSESRYMHANLYNSAPPELIPVAIKTTGGRVDWCCRLHTPAQRADRNKLRVCNLPSQKPGNMLAGTFLCIIPLDLLRGRDLNVTVIGGDWSPARRMLLGDAMDVAGIQNDFAWAHPHHFVIGPVSLLDDFQRPFIGLGRNASELGHHHSAVGTVVVDVGRWQALTGDARNVSFLDVTLL